MSDANQWEKVFHSYKAINGSYPLKSDPNNGTCVPLGQSQSDFTKTTASCYNNFDQGLIDRLKSVVGSLPKGGQPGGPSGSNWDGFIYRHNPSAPYDSKKIQFLIIGNSCGKYNRITNSGGVSICEIPLND